MSIAPLCQSWTWPKEYWENWPVPKRRKRMNRAHQVGCPKLRNNPGDCTCPKPVSKSQAKRLAVQRGS